MEGERKRKTDRQTNFVPNISFQNCGEVSVKPSSMERSLSALAWECSSRSQTHLESHKHGLHLPCYAWS